MPARRNGRPPLDADSPSVHITVRVSGRQYDALYEQARREGRTIPDVIRRSSRLLSTPKLDNNDDGDY
jgi:hypothetical protein